MKTVKYMMGIMSFVLVFGLASSASANKYADYRAVLESTKGARSVEPVAWKHINKFSREGALKSGLEGTMFDPIAPNKEGPKNFRNNTTM